MSAHMDELTVLTQSNESDFQTPGVSRRSRARAVLHEDGMTTL